MRSNLRCGLFTCALTLVGALLLRTTLLSHNYAEQQYHALRGHASRQAALRDARGAAAALVDAVAMGLLLSCHAANAPASLFSRRSDLSKITLNAAQSMISTPTRKVAQLPSLGTRSHISARATLRWSGVSARASKKLATGISPLRTSLGSPLSTFSASAGNLFMK